MLEQLRARIVRQGPAFLSLPLKVTPFVLQRHVLEQLLAWQFRQALAEDELAFLDGRWLQVDVRDLGLRWFVTVQQGTLHVGRHQSADVSFSADANDLILIAARKEDPDTLFFQRRLRIEGDTELGLQVKNLMDAIDPELMPAPLRLALIQLADFVEAGLREGTPIAARAVTSC
ncbi:MULTISPECIES: ubiquinone anaerobic biosynthesis accessory factor UbiT [Edwardsiella]|uniref:Ubiquinone biosynthesis accessory factor UbiT n=2 Tax=Edwardsiella anguillarum TaxID=1821960 RepID=A0A076LL64_9GAMM|nr:MULTISPECIES: SCP2 domain-containing protein [Edwardsiella]AKM46059.1 SCP-2 sterol transfer family protein [Edwardsiella sp. EA181011]GAJ67075.1 putative lipid carrier protein [Edwardsiella piscicida]AIJ08621.1 SCP-2 sterol transfer family protein [Edwardsiella anguillarum ET080813]AKR76663.1 SCP2 domain-containing protein [Edwardsiella sp. LADL05-105]KAB0592932.1 SCP2 domain-containing protein [Edwardsiella anguillarum]